jgi:SAM-dependent methyltransferase
MQTWETRLAREPPPRLRLEHELRYELAAPLVRRAALWADLGCGSGVAAEHAAAGFEGRAVLVDSAPDALEQAARLVARATTLLADLATPEGVERVRAILLDDPPPGERVITCFETLAHLERFAPLVELLAGLAEDERFTVLLSVPNDAFWALENPLHRTAWGEGSFEELHRLLPEPLVVLRQIPLAGSAVLVDGEAAGVLTLPGVDLGLDRVPSHFIAAFGPAAHEVGPLARAGGIDADAGRRRERQRESDLAVLEARLADPGPAPG